MIQISMSALARIFYMRGTFVLPGSVIVWMRLSLIIGHVEIIDKPLRLFWDYD